VNILLALLNTFWLAVGVAALAWLAMRLLPLNAATRYVIWWCVLAAVLLLPAVPHRRATVVTPSVSHRESAAASTRFDERALVTIPPPSKIPWTSYFLALWAATCAWRLAAVARSYLRLREMKRRAVAARIALPSISRRAALLVSSEVASPVAVGFLHPAVIIPEKLSAQLTACDLEHVLLHEVAHLARRDDWTNLAVRLLGAALALHPVALWILSCIGREREIACDDWVVARTGGARPYAASLARVYELRWAEREELLASGVNGRLSDRIALLLRRGREFSPRPSFVRVTVCSVVLVTLIAAGARAPHWIAMAQTPPQFAVASIRPDSSRPPVSLKFNPDGIAFTGVTLVNCIKAAYSVYDYQIVGADAWRSAEYDIVAKAEGNASREQLKMMLRALLAERFKLVVHTEKKEGPVFLLGVANGGPKLKRPPDDEPREGVRAGDGGLKFTRYTMPQLGEFLSQRGSLGRPVLDRTGIEGEYDFTLLIDGQAMDIATREGADAFKHALFDWPSIQEDLKRQLGLKLDSGKDTVEMLYIDHAEKPTAN
jgi:uncharacterized protein (TIGR03435 family)